MVAETGVVVYKKPGVSRSGRQSKASSKLKRKQIDHIEVELCVILLKSKVVKDTPQLVMVQRNQSTDSVSNSSETMRKRKPNGFVFKARDLSVTLSAPIETLENPTSNLCSARKNQQAVAI